MVYRIGLHSYIGLQSYNAILERVVSLLNYAHNLPLHRLSRDHARRMYSKPDLYLELWERIRLSLDNLQLDWHDNISNTLCVGLLASSVDKYHGLDLTMWVRRPWGLTFPLRVIHLCHQPALEETVSG